MTYSEDIVQKVWEKGRAMPDQDPTQWRQDDCGAWMHRAQYGAEEAEFAWKIENVAAGEADEVDNLRPFHQANFFDRNTGKAKCHLTADRQGLRPTEHIDRPRNKVL
jgi:hypothetical protein